jgi:hypothetical protein
MLSVWGPLELPFVPLQPANPAATHANSTKAAAAYPSRPLRYGHLLCSRAACCASAKNKIASHAAIHSGSTGMRSLGCGPVKGTTCDSAVVSVAVQSAFPELEAVPAVGVQVTALPKLLEPFLNCTVPVGPAPLLFVFTLAVNVTLPPDAILVTLGVTVVVVVACVTVTATVLLVLLELKLLLASAVYVAERW